MSSRNSARKSAAPDLVSEHALGGRNSSREASSAPAEAGPATAAPAEVILSGNVEKRRVDGGMFSSRRWRRRFLELHPTTLVWTREKKGKGIVFIDTDTELNETPPLPGRLGSITVSVPAEKRSLVFRCSSFDEHKEWVNQIQAAVEQAAAAAGVTPGSVRLGRKKSGSFMVGSSLDSSGSALEKFQAEREASKVEKEASKEARLASFAASMRSVEEDQTEEDKDEVRARREESDDVLGSADALCGPQVEARLLAIAGNATCADCMTSDPAHHPNTPAWGSTNLGSLFCIRCSGVHRKLGAHITKVLSIRIDSWSEAQLQAMEALGNDAVNAELEAEVPGNVEKPDLALSSMEELEAYIRAKYELGSFRQGGDGFVPHVRIKSESCVGMIEFVGVLFIRLEEAHDLPGSCDAYCEFQLGDRSCRSKTVKGSASSACRWAESLSLNTRSTKETLIIKVYDSSKLGMGGASFLGQAVVALASLTHDGQPNKVELGLSTSGGKSASRISRISRASTFTRTPLLSVELTYNALDR